MMGDEGLRALANCPELTRLTSLDLGWCGFTDEGVLALVTSPNLPMLTDSLDLTGGLPAECVEPG